MIALINRLDTPSDRVAEVAIRLLARKGRAAVPLLVAAARDHERPRVQKWSLEALGELRAGASILIDSLGHPRMTVRLHAVRALGRMRHRPAVRALTKLLSDESGGIRVNVLQALTRIGKAPPIVSVLASLGDAKWYVRREACIMSGALRVRGARTKLGWLTQLDPHPAVRRAAEAALRD